VRHNFDKAAVQDNGRHVLTGQEVQSRKTSDGHNSDNNAGMMIDPDGSAAIRPKDSMDNSTARGVTKKRNAKALPDSNLIIRLLAGANYG